MSTSNSHTSTVSVCLVMLMITYRIVNLSMEVLILIFTPNTITYCILLLSKYFRYVCGFNVCDISRKTHELHMQDQKLIHTSMHGHKEIDHRLTHRPSLQRQIPHSREPELLQWELLATCVRKMDDIHTCTLRIYPCTYVRVILSIASVIWEKCNRHRNC